MINITFPDGSVRPFESGVTGYEIASSISPRLAEEVLAIAVKPAGDTTVGRGVTYDLDRPILEDASIVLLKWEDEEGKRVFWHSSSHLMAEALEELFPGVKFGIGPAIENGFYYDVDLGGQTISDADFARIEALFKRFIPSRTVTNLLGGLVRMGLFLAYVWLVSRIPDIHRVFMYHGAEHKSIFCFESGKPLTVANAQSFTTYHPRCGTSFVVIVFVISILVFTLLGSDSSNVFARMGSRLLLLPVTAGVSYEILKWLGRAEDTPLVRALKWPGLMVQHITTAQPTDDMVEVALCSLRGALEMPNPVPKQFMPEDAPQSADEPAQPDAAEGENA